MDAVAAADGRRQFVLKGAALQHVQQPIQIGKQYVRRAGELHRKAGVQHVRRSEEHTSELQSLMRISYAVVCLKKKKRQEHDTNRTQQHTQTDIEVEID